MKNRTKDAEQGKLAHIKSLTAHKNTHEETPPKPDTPHTASDLFGTNVKHTPVHFNTLEEVDNALTNAAVRLSARISELSDTESAEIATIPPGTAPSLAQTTLDPINLTASALFFLASVDACFVFEKHKDVVEKALHNLQELQKQRNSKQWSENLPKKLKMLEKTFKTYDIDIDITAHLDEKAQSSTLTQIKEGHFLLPAQKDTDKESSSTLPSLFQKSTLFILPHLTEHAFNTTAKAYKHAFVSAVKHSCAPLKTLSGIKDGLKYTLGMKLHQDEIVQNEGDHHAQIIFKGQTRAFLGATTALTAGIITTADTLHEAVTTGHHIIPLFSYWLATFGSAGTAYSLYKAERRTFNTLMPRLKDASLLEITAASPHKRLKGGAQKIIDFNELRAKRRQERLESNIIRRAEESLPQIEEWRAQQHAEYTLDYYGNPVPKYDQDDVFLNKKALPLEADLQFG